MGVEGASLWSDDENGKGEGKVQEDGGMVKSVEELMYRDGMGELEGGRNNIGIQGLIEQDLRTRL